MVSVSSSVVWGEHLPCRLVLKTSWSNIHKLFDMGRKGANKQHNSLFSFSYCIFYPLASATSSDSLFLEACCCCCQVASVVSDSVQPHRRQPTGLPCPWDSPGKNTGVGCHFLLQCMKVKNESEVAQSCPTPSDPMDCSPPGSPVPGILQARTLEWVAISFSNA